MMSSRTKRSFTDGPIFSRMLWFVIPIMLTSVLQLLYNMADHIVVGQFSGDDNALAAIGCTTSLTGLVTNLFVGITAGAGVVVARSFGAKNYSVLSRAVHTTMLFALIGGVAFSLLGVGISSPALSLMGTKDEIFDQAVLYMRIVCLGIPATSVYNFGATILRSVGDSKTSLYVLASSGIVNVALNLFFVIVCGMSVEGVAIATIISQYISATWVVFVLWKRKSEPYALSFGNLRIEKNLLLQVLKLGVPAGIQSSLFGISNIMITSAVNSFSTATIAAKTIGANIDSILYSSLNSYLHASMTFTAQNYGAGKPDRIKRSILSAMAQVLLIGVSLGLIMYAIGPYFSALFVEDGNANRDLILSEVMKMLSVTTPFYFMCGIMESLSGTLRGLGTSFTPMLMSIGGICGLRILWILIFFPMEAFNSIQGVYLCYPISWTATAAILLIALLLFWKKLKKNGLIKAGANKQERTNG